MGQCTEEGDICCIRTVAEDTLSRERSSIPLPGDGICPSDYPNQKGDRCFK
jgi:hypothetical protein